MDAGKVRLELTTRPLLHPPVQHPCALPNLEASHLTLQKPIQAASFIKSLLLHALAPAVSLEGLAPARRCPTGNA